MPVPVAQLEQIALGTCPKRNDLHEFFLPEKLEALSANGVQCQLGVINTRCGEAAADKDEELFDIVDEENNVVGQERRNVVHAQGIKHRAVYCFVFNSQGQLLLQQRSAK